PWDAGFDKRVLALAVHGNVLYAGGDFEQAGGRARGHVAAFDLRRGTLLPFAPAADRRVEALAYVGSARLPAGGRLRQIAGGGGANLAVVNARTGRPLAHGPRVDGEVHALAVSGRTAYVGGSFLHVNDTRLERLAALDVDGWRVTDFHADATGGDVLAL